MALVDEVTLNLKAGRGGDGVVRWRHEKFIRHGGPYGGNGGKGGDVYFEAVRDITYLRHYRVKTNFEAEHGKPGDTAVRTGREGKDLVLKLPVGSIIRRLETNKTYELLTEKKRILVLHGGKGGRGNHSYKSATNRSPYQFQYGFPGEEGTFSVELELIADVGIIGLPNAGKTTLLNALTHAAAKVGAYPFTTLEPNLGALGPIILADIPGLIAGASRGKGLGDAFLKHASRTKMLLHCIGLDEKNWLERYNTIREELGAFKKELLTKPETIVLTKADLAEDTALADAKKALAVTKRTILVVSRHNAKTIGALARHISRNLAS